MKTYIGTFLKKTGEKRTMQFVKLEDLPKDFLNEVVKGGKKKSLNENMEVVWDIEKKGFRIFNWETIQGKVRETNFSLDIDAIT